MTVVRDFYKKSFAQFDENLVTDASIAADEKDAFYDFLENCSTKPQIEKSEPSAAQLLIEDVYNNFIKAGNYRFKGKQPEGLTSKEPLGYVVKKSNLIRHLKQESGKTDNQIEDLLEEIISQPDIVEKEKLFQRFIALFGRFPAKRKNSTMWSFRYFQSTGHAFNPTDKELPFLLALPDCHDGQAYYYFKHTLANEAHMPRTFDTGLDNNLFRPGGYTLPLGKYSSSPGMAEIIHNPNNFDRSELVVKISNYLS